MKKVLTAAAVVAPGAASACAMGGGAGGGCLMSGGGHAASVLMAATSALGYWIVRSSAKDSGAAKWAGQSVGWVLLVVGLGGFLCGSLSHAFKRAGGSSSCMMGGSGGGSVGIGEMRMPPGHPPIGGMDDAPPAASKDAKKAK